MINSVATDLGQAPAKPIKKITALHLARMLAACVAAR